METKKKVCELSYEQLREKLLENYIKVGIRLPADDVALRIIIKEIFRFHAQLWVETLDDSFSYYAAKRLPSTEKIKPEVSSYFITQIRDAFFLMFKQKKEEKTKKDRHVTDHERAYTNFMQHIELYRKYPVKPNWLMLLDHLVNTGYLAYYEGWEKETLKQQISDARREVKQWTKKNVDKIFKNPKAIQSAAA